MFHIKICFMVSYFVCVVYLWSFVLGMEFEKEKKGDGGN